MQFLVCVECGLNRMPAPGGSSALTRFTCRSCVERLMTAAHVEEAQTRIARFSQCVLAKNVKVAGIRREYQNGSREQARQRPLQRLEHKRYIPSVLCE